MIVLILNLYAMAWFSGQAYHLARGTARITYRLWLRYFLLVFLGFAGVNLLALGLTSSSSKLSETLLLSFAIAVGRMAIVAVPALIAWIVGMIRRPKQIGETEMFYSSQDGEVLGPFEALKIASFISTGSLREDVMVCREGSEEWIEWAAVKTCLRTTSGSDRTGRLIDERFQGGAAGVVRKMQEVMDRVREMLPPMLNDLQMETAPGLSWANIFLELPDPQKQRQREIYRRLMLDERTKGLTQEKRLALTNELEKAWQLERRKVFLCELEKPGVLGEKDQADREKVAKALPRLLRHFNLGDFNGETFREGIAPEYGLVPLTEPQAMNHWRNWIKERIETTKESLKPSKSMNYRIFIPALVTALILGALLHSWLGERYRVFAAGNGWVMKTDRWTGQTWKCYGSGHSWIPVQEAR